jgi:hypothetical protein
MHVLFLAPDTHVYNHLFLQGLTSIGARVSAIGPAPLERLAPAAKRLLAGYRQVTELLEPNKLLAAARELAKPRLRPHRDHRRTAGRTRRALRETLRRARPAARDRALCRDKVAMKAFLREHDIPCAQSAAATTEAEARAFAERGATR